MGTFLTAHSTHCFMVVEPEGEFMGCKYGPDKDCPERKPYPGIQSELTVEKMVAHYGHKIVFAKYGDENIALECETCSEVLQDANI